MTTTSCAAAPALAAGGSGSGGGTFTGTRARQIEEALRCEGGRAGVTGGDLAEILDKIGSLIRERFKIWGQVQALTGEGRLSGVVLLALPPLLFLAVYRLNRDYVMMLFTDEMGKKMLLGAVVMQLLGALVIRKIVNIKV